MGVWIRFDTLLLLNIKFNQILSLFFDFQDNTVLKAQRAQIVAVKDELCVINVEGDASGEIFDYDIETGLRYCNCKKRTEI